MGLPCRWIRPRPRVRPRVRLRLRPRLRVRPRPRPRPRPRVRLRLRAVALPNAPVKTWVAGVTDRWTRAHDVDKALSEVPEDTVVIAITHNPDVFVDVPKRVSLTLAGQTHGGQVRVPFWGPPVVPSAYGQRFAAGHVVEDGRYLFRERGGGDEHPAGALRGATGGGRGDGARLVTVRAW